MDYLFVKWLHILSATILFGAGVGSAFFLFMANRRKDLAGIVVATRHVVLADWLFTTPAAIVQLATGLALVWLGGFRLTQGWIAGGLALYVFVGGCWLPVVFIQIRMREMARFTLKSGGALPADYWTLDRWWKILGSLAFPAMAAIFWLMVTKPSL
jgi:uncharacterized membrane protein